MACSQLQQLASNSGPGCDNWEGQSLSGLPCQEPAHQVWKGPAHTNVHDFLNKDCTLAVLQEALALEEGLSGPASHFAGDQGTHRHYSRAPKLTNGEGNVLPVSVGCPRLAQLLNLLHVASIQDEQGLQAAVDGLLGIPALEAQHGNEKQLESLDSCRLQSMPSSSF